MADEQRGKGGQGGTGARSMIGRLFSRAQERRREARREEARPSPAPTGRGGEDRAYRTLQEQRAREDEAARIRARDIGYRETGGGYGGYGGTADRDLFRPREARFGAGYSDYGPRRPWEAGGGWSPGRGADWEQRWERGHWELGGAEDQPRHPRGLGAYDEESPIERGFGRTGDWHARAAGQAPPTRRPHGLGGYDLESEHMERGMGPHLIDNREEARAGIGGIVGGMHAGGYEEERRYRPGAFERLEGYRGGGAESVQLRGGGRSRAPGEERIGPGAWRREGEGPRWPRGHHGRAWEGAPGERDEAWFHGERGVRAAGRGAGPGEHFGDWFGGPPQRESRESEWYGGGVHEARDQRTAQDFGELGGPRHGRYGTEIPEDRGGGRGFGGPLGRFQERFEGEQGRLYGGEYRGREDEFPIRGEAIAGRGHVGGEDFRDLTRWGEGGDRRTHGRYLEQHDEPDHFRNR